MNTNYRQDNPRRRSMRLRGFNYAHPGAYFITVSTHNRVCLLGDVLDDKMHLSEAGRLAQAVWEGLPTHYPHIRLDAWVVMPNHVHGIVMLTEANADPDPHPVDPDPVRAGFKPAPSATGTDANNARHCLPEIVRAFKTFSARRINAVRGGSRYISLAAQLLRTHHSRRRDPEPHPPIHHGQSGTLA